MQRSKIQIGANRGKSKPLLLFCSESISFFTREGANGKISP